MGLSFNGRTNRSRRLNPGSIPGGSILQFFKKSSIGQKKLSIVHFKKSEGIEALITSKS